MKKVSFAIKLINQLNIGSWVVLQILSFGIIPKITLVLCPLIAIFLTDMIVFF